MSIVNKKSGRYIKVIRELSVFRPNSVQVFYYSFGSRAEKEEFFARGKAVEEFVRSVSTYLEQEYSIVHKDIESFATIEGLTELKLEVLPKRLRSRLDELSRLHDSTSIIQNEWSKLTPLPKFDNLNKLVELGFDEAWLVPLPCWELSSVHTGAFTNQNFTYECLYAELKKIFKDDFVDC